MTRPRHPRATRPGRLGPALAALLVTLLVASLALVGCSSGGGTSAGPDDGAAAQEAQGPTLEQVMADVTERAEAEGLVLGEGAEERVGELYDEGTYDPDAILSTLDGEGLLGRAPAEGVMVLNYTRGEVVSHEDTGTPKCLTFTMSIDVIDPETGEAANYRTFSTMETESCSAAADTGIDTYGIQMLFNEDMTLMAATLTTEDGSAHVGWVDEKGCFTDVSAQVTSPNSFDGVVRHADPRFGPDGYLYYLDQTDSENVCARRVPCDRLEESAVETLLEDVRFSGTSDPLPDGSLKEDGGATWRYYDASTVGTWPASAGEFYDWLSPTECVGSEDGMIYRYVLSGEQDIFEWDAEKTPLVREVTGRENCFPVVSPEGDRVAFLSRLTTGTDGSMHLYVVPVEGGEPTLVETDYDLTGTDGVSTICLANWR